MKIYDEVGNILKNRFANREFTMEQFIRSLGPSYSIGTLKSYFHSFQNEGAIEKIGEAPTSKGGKSPYIYRVKSVAVIDQLLNTPLKITDAKYRKLARLNNVEVSETKVSAYNKPLKITDAKYRKLARLNNVEVSETEFSAYNKPAKVFVTDALYTLFSSYCWSVKNSLILSGPNVKRFLRNIKKISHPFARMVIIEGGKDKAQYINHLLSAYSIEQRQVPKFEVVNTLLEDYPTDQFFQFEDLDCNGMWSTLYNTYQNRLKAQAEKDSKVIKGFIFTICERGTSKLTHSENIKSLISSNLGTEFLPGSIFDHISTISKKFYGEWNYLEEMRLGKVKNLGRLISMIIYRYRHRTETKTGGNIITTAMLIYR